MRRMSLSILRFVSSPFIRCNTLTLLRPTRSSGGRRCAFPPYALIDMPTSARNFIRERLSADTFLRASEVPRTEGPDGCLHL